jgi:dTDP-4-amino-4,6-dideoxygalactose transaminase
MEALQATLDAGWVAPAGPVPAAFEQSIANTIGLPHVLAVTSGTAALHLGYQLLGVCPGDEVWTSSLTFIASIGPAVQMGATPRFLDVTADNWTMDVDLLRAELACAARRGRLPRVVVPVDLYGQPADMPAIVDACAAWGVPVLSDSAESLGAMQHGLHAGADAQLMAISFNGNKIITAGGGGALASADGALIARARHLASQAKDAAPHYQHEVVGFSYAMSSVLAAVGQAQLAVLADRVLARRAIHARYRAGLDDLPGVSFIAEPNWSRSNRWLTVIRLDPQEAWADRETIRRALAAEQIESRPVWKPLHLQPAFRAAPQAGGDVAAGLFEQGLCLPSGSSLSLADQNRVIAVIRRCCGG